MGWGWGGGLILDVGGEMVFIFGNVGWDTFKGNAKCHRQNVSSSAASESFDEPLTKAQVLLLVDGFIV